MEETDLETPSQAVPESESSKTPLVVCALALVGAGALAKKGFNKARQFRVIRKDRLDALEKNQSAPQAK